MTWYPWVRGGDGSWCGNGSQAGRDRQAGVRKAEGTDGCPVGPFGRAPGSVKRHPVIPSTGRPARSLVTCDLLDALVDELLDATSLVGLRDEDVALGV
jgi:hypothetical protein